MIPGFRNDLQRNDDLYTIAAGFCDLSGLKVQTNQESESDASFGRIRNLVRLLCE